MPSSYIDSIKTALEAVRAARAEDLTIQTEKTYLGVNTFEDFRIKLIELNTKAIGLNDRRSAEGGFPDGFAEEERARKQFMQESIAELESIDKVAGVDPTQHFALFLQKFFKNMVEVQQSEEIGHDKIDTDVATLVKPSTDKQFQEGLKDESGVLHVAETMGKRREQEDEYFFNDLEAVGDPERFLNRSIKRLCDHIYHDPELNGVGSTAVIGHLTPENKLTVGSVGDSRLVLFVENESGGYDATRLTKDHNADDSFDRLLVESNGGIIYRQNRYGAHRVDGQIAAGRTIGDKSFPSLNNEADFREIDLNEYTNNGRKKAFLVTSCDGLYENFQEDRCAKILSELAKGGKKLDQAEVASALRNAAYNSGSKDNITVMAHDLSTPRTKDIAFGIFDGHAGGDVSALAKKKMLEICHDPLILDQEPKYENSARELHKACASGDVEKVRMLLDKLSPKQLNIQDSNGFTPLYHAINNKHPEIAQMLIPKIEKTEFEKPTAKTPHFIPLHIAAENGDFASANLILQSMRAEGIKRALTCAREDGMTALHLACEKGFADIAKLLVSAESLGKTNSNRNSKTALHYAVENGHVEVVEHLIEFAKTHDPDLTDTLNTPNITGLTALGMAAKQVSNPQLSKKREKIGELLIDAFDPKQLEASTPRTGTLADLFQKNNATECVAKLSEKGVHLTSPPLGCR